ncbi:hypothetical protein [Parenemella sanctibonifatiensis]|uniref:Uncharacterized protein n=1 Tax=Parenemella sanctibonifatiensis TaxID=2016505 RepID=A0A255E976_9ACTN|nr:hypothetical protein [Parenemella sanctibonifatiensis]OYN84683.1 hypothetical protein CGZ92_12720 [Parenemella sanctibonifatiensis]
MKAEQGLAESRFPALVSDRQYRARAWFGLAAALVVLAFLEPQFRTPIIVLCYIPVLITLVLLGAQARAEADLIKMERTKIAGLAGFGVARISAAVMFVVAVFMVAMLTFFARIWAPVTVAFLVLGLLIHLHLCWFRLNRWPLRRARLARRIKHSQLHPVHY